MEMKITTLEGKAAGSVDLPDAIFGLDPRSDILQRCVNWQLAKRQRGTHKTKDRSEIWRTGKKIYAQKGTGGARHGSARVPQFRGGGRAFGPVVRSHAIDLPKKVRALALKHALSSKAKDGGIIVIDKATVKDAKTKALATKFDKLGLENALIIDGAEIEANFRSAARNIPNIDVLCDVKVKNVNTLTRKGKFKVFKNKIGQQSDVKRAIVTLEEGHRIDVTTGL
jgi:large subunit ribosomal protein L4